jgi:hypothetical protein
LRAKFKLFFQNYSGRYYNNEEYVYCNYDDHEDDYSIDKIISLHSCELAKILNKIAKHDSVYQEQCLLKLLLPEEMQKKKARGAQVSKLNSMVINWSSDEIITNIDQYMKYKETVSTLPMPLERSQLSSQKGTKTLEIKSFV